MQKNNKHTGSTFESFLEEEGIFEEVHAAALKMIVDEHAQESTTKIDCISGSNE